MLGRSKGISPKPKTKTKCSGADISPNLPMHLRPRLKTQLSRLQLLIVSQIYLCVLRDTSVKISDMVCRYICNNQSYVWRYGSLMVITATKIKKMQLALPHFLRRSATGFTLFLSLLFLGFSGSLSAQCSADGGTLSLEDGSNINIICADDGISDAFTPNVEGASGDNFAWVIASAGGNILELPSGPPFDLEGAGPLCRRHCRPSRHRYVRRF